MLLLYYEFSLNISTLVCFRTPIYPALVFAPYDSEPGSVFSDKMWEQKRGRVFFSVRSHLYTCIILIRPWYGHTRKFDFYG